MSEPDRPEGRFVPRPWTVPPETALKRTDSAADGLSEAEAQQRLRKIGSNRLQPPKRRGVGEILFDQVKSLFMLLLGTASVAAFLFGEWFQGLAIAAALGINTLLGFFMEWRAARSMESLQKLGGVVAKVRRAGETRTVDAEQVVPGDIILLLDAGDLVTADARLTEASKLQVDESPLTGESTPVTIAVDAIERDAPLAERTNMLYRGTFVTRGSAEGVVVATGMATELGESRRWSRRRSTKRRRLTGDFNGSGVG